jgi:hypothetical protein
MKFQSGKIINPYRETRWISGIEKPITIDLASQFICINLSISNEIFCKTTLSHSSTPPKAPERSYFLRGNSLQDFNVQATALRITSALLNGYSLMRNIYQ